MWGGGRRRGRGRGGDGRRRRHPHPRRPGPGRPLAASSPRSSSWPSRASASSWPTRAAAMLTRYPAGLASALRKISADTEPLEAANKATAHLYIVNPLKNLKGGPAQPALQHPPAHRGAHRRPREDVGGMRSLHQAHSDAPAAAAGRPPHHLGRARRRGRRRPPEPQPGPSRRRRAHAHRRRRARPRPLRLLALGPAPVVRPHLRLAPLRDLRRLPERRRPLGHRRRDRLSGLPPAPVSPAGQGRPDARRRGLRPRRQHRRRGGPLPEPRAQPQHPGRVPPRRRRRARERGRPGRGRAHRGDRLVHLGPHRQRGRLPPHPLELGPAHPRFLPYLHGRRAVPPRPRRHPRRRWPRSTASSTSTTSTSGRSPRGSFR